MNKSHLIGAFCAVLFTFITVSANAALVSRLGGAAAYDDVLDITWLTDADLSGANTWANQLTWVAGLNTANHLGFNDWRLASMSVAAGLPTGTTPSVFDCGASPSTTEPACRDNELGYMYWHNMGGTGSAKTGNQTVDGVLLTDVQSIYWSGTEFSSSDAWIFYYYYGQQGTITKDLNLNNYWGWAVRAGDVSAVPVPAGAVLPTPAAGLPGKSEAESIQNFDIVGLKLGMSDKQVIELMKNYEGTSVIKELHNNYSLIPDSEYVQSVASHNGVRSEITEFLYADYFRPPQEPKAAYVARWVKYSSEEQPALEAVESALLEKYGGPSRIDRHSSYTKYIWAIKKSRKLEWPEGSNANAVKILGEDSYMCMSPFFSIPMAIDNSIRQGWLREGLSNMESVLKVGCSSTVLRIAIRHSPNEKVVNELFASITYEPSMLDNINKKKEYLAK